MAVSQTLFLSVDFINDIVHPEGRISSCAPMVAACDVIGRTNRGLAWARAQGFQVAHVKVGFQPGYANCPATSPIFGSAAQFGALALGSWGTEFHQDLAVEADEFVIVKSRIGVFYNTALETLLRAKQVQHIVLAGASTNHAIESAARDAHDRDYRVTVLSDCCAAADPEIHRQTLAGVVSHVAEIHTLDELMAGLIGRAILVPITGVLQRTFDLPYCARTALAVLPALALYLHSGDLFALKAGLIGVYLLIVAKQTRPAGLLLLLHAVSIGVSIGLFCLAFAHPWLFVPFCAAYGAATQWLSRWGSRWQSISTFSFIPALYLGCELNSIPNRLTAYRHLLHWYPAALLPVAIISFYGVYHARCGHWRAALRDYCRIDDLLPRQQATRQSTQAANDGAAIRAAAVCLAALLVESFHLEAGEWLIWSAASVTTGTQASAWRKHHDRLWGALTGVPLGLAASFWLRPSEALYGCAVLAVAVSIATFRHYRLAFSVRCGLCVVAAAALGHSSGVGWLRVANVVLGGLAGILATSLYYYCRPAPDQRRP